MKLAALMLAIFLGAFARPSVATAQAEQAATTLSPVLPVSPISSSSAPAEQDQTPNYLQTGRQISQILNGFMSLGYDKRVRPNYGGPPVSVNVTMRILSISSVSEVMMDFTADFYFRQTWQDPRLAFRKIGDIHTLYVGAEVSKRIWIPDTFFGNEKMAYFHEATTPNVFLRIDHSGEVYRSIRLTVTSSCPMNLQYFPMDNQRCTIEAESYGYNVKDIIYRWAHKDTAVEREKEISLPQFDIVRTVQKYRLEELSSGTYSRLIAEIHFARRMGYYLIQIYIPSSLIVVISWVSFWLHRNASPARVQLGVTTVLTMTTLMSSTNAALPKISYVKSIDIFLGTCFIMVFAALLEYATVGYLGKRIAMRKAHIQHAQSQAHARLFAQLQAQGAQGEPIEHIPTSTCAINQMDELGGHTGSAGNLAVLAQKQPTARSQLQALSSSQLLLDKASSHSLPAERLHHQHHHQRHHHLHLDHPDESQQHLSRDPSPPPRHCRSTRCHFHSTQNPPEPTTCYLPKAQQFLSDNNSRCLCALASSQEKFPTCHLLHPLQFNSNIAGQTHTGASCVATIPSELKFNNPTAGTRKGPAAAAAAAAATFINMHRKSKGLPPTSSPNFTQFGWSDYSVRNKNIETIFGIRPSDIDKYSRVVFPVCFICFQLMYWIVYLHISAFLDTELQQQQSA